ncbi:MAG: thioredoxin-dependent thiol peroxidase [Flammeovirgaceae bacterium]|nr:thioredoxin-dependent thiol peroxidase [Flammeovirgaceae bacterium]
MALVVGSKAPAFKTVDQDGLQVSLSEFKGKKVVLYFYPRDLTPGCTAEACSLRDNYKALQKAGYEVLGISTDTPKSHKKFIEKEKLPFRLLADEDKTVHEKFGAWVEKSMYGRKYMGTARITYLIDEQGVIEDIIEKVDTKNHASQILETSNSGSTKADRKPSKKSSSQKAKKTSKK